MEQIKLNNISLDYGDNALFKNLSLQINRGEKIALIGRNGTGKSTLLKSITGEVKVDNGEVVIANGLRIAELQQSVPRNLSGTVLDLVCLGLDKEDDESWQQQYLAEEAITKLGLDKNAQVNKLSGGNIRRALLAQALVSSPDILLLDEPTNHLDLPSINWLENFLQKADQTIILITHDRTFMQKIANKIIELDRGKLISFTGSYEDFLKHKQQQLEAEETANTLFDKKLAEEEKWIRQGIKARRTRNEGRVRALKQMRSERSQRRDLQGTVNIDQNNAHSSGQIVFEIKNLKITRDNKQLVSDFSTTIVRGEKIGIIGANGCGKSSFISTLLNKIEPTAGTVRAGTKLEVAYFDQHRLELDPEMTAIDCVAEGKQYVSINGKEKHIISYLQDFLFTAEKSRSKVSVLSGGERNRLLLAKILAKPCNLLIMDEPSNDLDQETLELVEEYLANYQGTLLLVSHDRTLLNNVVTSIISFDENSTLQQYVGGYDDWLRQKQQAEPSPQTTTNKTKRNSHQERKKLEKLMNQITKHEQKIEELQNKMSAIDYPHNDKQATQKDTNTLSELNEKLEELYNKWDDLDK